MCTNRNDYFSDGKKPVDVSTLQEGIQPVSHAFSKYVNMPLWGPASKFTIIGSDNGLSPCRRQAII